MDDILKQALAGSNFRAIFELLSISAFALSVPVNLHNLVVIKN